MGGYLFAQISAGGEQERGTTCAVTPAHKGYCWGSGYLGRRGDNNGSVTSAVVSPRAVAGSQLFAQIAVGYTHTCVVNTNDRAWCWGDNSSGELGDGTTTMRLTPTKVLGTLSFAQLSTGDLLDLRDHDGGRWILLRIQHRRQARRQHPGRSPRADEDRGTELHGAPESRLGANREQGSTRQAPYGSSGMRTGVGREPVPGPAWRRRVERRRGGRAFARARWRCGFQTVCNS